MGLLHLVPLLHRNDFVVFASSSISIYWLAPLALLVYCLGSQQWVDFPNRSGSLLEGLLLQVRAITCWGVTLPLSPAFSVLGICILLKGVKLVLGVRAFSAFVTANECLTVRVAPNPFPWALRRKYEVIKLDGDLLDDYTYRKYRDYGLTHACNTVFTQQQKGICTIEPENIKAVLATKFDDYERPRYRASAATPFLGPGIFTSDGPAWAHGRGMLRSQITRHRIEENIQTSERHVRYLFQAIGNPDCNGWTRELDLMDFFYRFTLDASTEFLFGASAHSQIGGLINEGKTVTTADAAQARYMDSFEEAFKSVASYVGIRLRLGKSYWMCDGIGYRRACSRLSIMVDRFIADAKARTFQRHQASSPSSNSHSNLIEALLADGADDIDMRNQCMHLLIAGMDTTAGLLGWTFALLELHPTVIDSLRSAVLASFGNKAGTVNTFTFESLKNCSYLQYVILETLRLYPAGPVNARVAVRDTVLPVGGGEDGKGPVAVRRGSRVQFCTYLTQRRKDIWGEDANEFRPERWQGRRKGWEFTPFSAGPQICIGQQYSMTQAALVIASFMMKYESMEKCTDGQDNLKKGWKTVLTPANGVRLRLRVAA